VYLKPALATRRRRLVALIAVVFVALFAAWALIARGDRDAATLARVDDGVIDLRGHDFARTPVLSLEGDWRGCARQLLAPAEYAAGQRPACDRALRVPGRWRERTLADPSGDAQNYATLHLRLLLPASEAPLALRLVGFFPANRVWLDERLVAQTGRLATRVGDEVGDLALQFIALPAAAGAYELVIQASNFDQIAVGSMRAEVGVASVIDAQQTRRWALAMAAAGVLLLMGGYHLALYGFRRSEIAPLYLGLNSLLWVGNVLCMGISEWPIRVFVAAAPGELLYRIWPFCLFLASAFAYQFFRALYPQEFPRWIARVIWLASLIGALIALAAPLRWLAAFMPAYALLTVARLAYSAWALARAARRGRPGAAIIFCGYFLVLLLTINDCLNWLGVIHTVATVHLGMIVYMFAQALALALRFSLLHAAVEKLSTTLEGRNRALAAEVAERSRLQHEIVSVSEEERRRMSRELHDGLCQQLTAARLQCSGLANLAADDECDERGGERAARRQNELDRLASLLEAAVDHAYDLARGLWPMEQSGDDAVAMLSALVRRRCEASGCAIELVRRGGCANCATSHAAQLYGIAREAIANALKHARPTRITLTLDCAAVDAVTLTIDDDGQAPARPYASRDGLGLRIMVYRAQMVGGEFAVESRPSGGTRARCTLPCAQGQRRR
jgi:signal transduction histidine kinase